MTSTPRRTRTFVTLTQTRLALAWPSQAHAEACEDVARRLSEAFVPEFLLSSDFDVYHGSTAGALAALFGPDAAAAAGMAAPGAAGHTDHTVTADVGGSAGQGPLLVSSAAWLPRVKAALGDFPFPVMVFPQVTTVCPSPHTPTPLPPLIHFAHSPHHTF